MKKILLKLVALASVTLPAFVYAQTGKAFTTLTTIINQIGSIIKLLIPIVFALAILAFFWGLVKYIFSQGSEESKAEGKNIMLWALIALFVMASVFGIIQLAQNTLDIQKVDTITPPKVNF